MILINFSRFFKIFHDFFLHSIFFHHFTMLKSCISPQYYNCFHITPYLKVWTFPRRTTTSLLLVGPLTCASGQKILLKQIKKLHQAIVMLWIFSSGSFEDNIFVGNQCYCHYGNCWHNASKKAPTITFPSLFFMMINKNMPR